MKVGIYPGSFDPWTIGHQDILDKALQVFDRVVVCVMQNPEKRQNESGLTRGPNTDRVEVVSYEGLLVDAVKKFTASAVIRGLRNGFDLEKEMNSYYVNQELGLTVPVVFFAADKEYSHISSTATRIVRKLKNDPEWAFKKRS